MSYIFKKYEFQDQDTANTRIEALPEGHKHSVVELGYLWITEPTFDEDGNEITSGVKSEKYSVDVLWCRDEIVTYEEQVVDGVTHNVATVTYPYGWASKEIQYQEDWVSTNGAHTFMGWQFYEG